MAGFSVAELNNRLSDARTAAELSGLRQEFAVDQGLRIRVYPTGKAAFAYRYRPPGSKVLRTLMNLPGFGGYLT